MSTVMCNLRRVGESVCPIVVPDEQQQLVRAKQLLFADRVDDLDLRDGEEAVSDGADQQTLAMWPFLEHRWQMTSLNQHLTTGVVASTASTF